MRSVAIGFVVLGIGCAHEPVELAHPNAPLNNDLAASGWERREGAESSRLYDDSGRPYASSATTLDEDRFQPQTLAPAPEPEVRRPRRVGKRDIALHRARLDNALRMLARAGKFNLVVENDLSTLVTLDLHRVEPFDAAMALAEAHHLEVRFTRGIVIVGNASVATGAR